MKKQYFNILLLSMVVLFVLTFLVCSVFAGCDSKKKSSSDLRSIAQSIPQAATQEEEAVTVWQKIKVSTTKGKTFEINDPEIDYSDYSRPKEPIEDYDSFGIRIGKGDETETIPWEEISHIDIAVKGKNVLKAKIQDVDGNIIEAELAPDSKEGLSGTSGSEPFKIRLKDIKAIDVIK